MLEAGESYHDLVSLVRAKARKNGPRPAARFSTRSLSYSELDIESDRVAAGLVRAGVAPYDRVAVMVGNRPEYLPLWFGVLKARGTIVPLNTGLKGEILRYELADSAPSAAVVENRFWNAYLDARNPTSRGREWCLGGPGGPRVDEVPPGEQLLAAEGEVSQLTPGGWEPASILYTSGTTGPPKGAVIPHERSVRTPLEVGRRATLTPESILFTSLPLFHCNAQEKTMILAMLFDLTAAFDEKFHASKFWSTAQHFGATHVSLLTSMITVLLKQPSTDRDRSHGVRVAMTAGTTVGQWKGFEERFGLKVIESYGMTECGCTTIMNPPDAVRVGSVGLPLGFVEADVVDEHDGPVPVGGRGELVVRPRAPFTMFSGYLNKPEQTVEAWRNLWFHTGDFVTRDVDGYYYFVDRKKDVIRRRGENLAPYDVESVLNRHPAVFESVVVGVPSPLGEEDVKAFVQLNPGATLGAKELFEYCVTELPFFMVPRYIEFIEEIPRTANQKAQRYVLRQRKGGVEHDREVLAPAGRRDAPPSGG